MLRDVEIGDVGATINPYSGQVRVARRELEALIGHEYGLQREALGGPKTDLLYLPWSSVGVEPEFHELTNPAADKHFSDAMKAKELYRVLETELGPWLKAHDFKKQRGFRLTFQRVVDNKYHSVWFQCDKYGWDSYAGGQFFVNFTVSESADVEGGSRREERLNFFLTDIELARARKYRDEVVARIPKPPESHFNTLEAAFAKTTGRESAASLIKTVREQFEPASIPYRQHQDFRLRYWQPNDVAGWAAIIASVLPRAIVQMQSWSLPQPRT